MKTYWTLTTFQKVATIVRVMKNESILELDSIFTGFIKAVREFLLGI